MCKHEHEKSVMLYNFAVYLSSLPLLCVVRVSDVIKYKISIHPVVLFPPYIIITRNLNTERCFLFYKEANGGV